jgi:DNA-3-methyladenine glycosylase II
MSTVSSGFLKAQRHLARRDPVLKRLIAAVGPCTLQINPDGFAALARSIVSQQISTKAARSILARLEESLLPRPLEAAAVLALPEPQLRSAGLSAAKTRYLRDLAEQVVAGAVPLDDLHAMEDEEVIARLLPVKGIGRWTAQMFLIFSLGRLDVLPVDDLGLRLGVQEQYALPEAPGKDELTQLAEPWQPYRSVATWYFWRSRGFVPQSR